MTSKELQDRTKKFAAEVISFVESMPRSYSTDIVGRQLIRSSTSVAANYRAAGRARSTADFINKLGIVEEEADETLFWFEMLIEAKKVKEGEILKLIQEAKEIVAIFSTAHKTAKRNRNR
jgi:four helix bundle protein